MDATQRALSPFTNKNLILSMASAISDEIEALA